LVPDDPNTPEILNLEDRRVPLGVQREQALQQRAPELADDVLQKSQILLVKGQVLSYPLHDARGHNSSKFLPPLRIGAFSEGPVLQHNGL
jgi:hypothetical protein